MIYSVCLSLFSRQLLLKRCLINNQQALRHLDLAKQNRLFFSKKVTNKNTFTHEMEQIHIIYFLLTQKEVDIFDYVSISICNRTCDRFINMNHFLTA